MDYALVNVDAAARQEVTPDVLTVAFTATEDGVNSAGVTEALKRRLNDALSLVKPRAVPQEVVIETGTFTVQPKWTTATRSKTATLDGYVGKATLVVSGTDTNTISELAGAITSMLIVSTEHSVSRTLREKVEAQVLDEAIQAFRAKGRSIAKSFGFAGAKTVEVRISPEYDRGARAIGASVMPMSASASPESAPLATEAGTTTIGIQVSGQVQMVD